MVMKSEMKQWRVRWRDEGVWKYIKPILQKTKSVGWGGGGGKKLKHILVLEFLESDKILKIGKCFVTTYRQPTNHTYMYAQMDSMVGKAKAN